MKKLPKVNTSKLLKAALPYILVGLMATKLGQAYRMASGGDVLDRILGAFLKIGEAFANPLPSLHPFDLLVGDACGALLWFIVYQKSKNARKYRRGAEYGTARWGNAKDIEPFIDPDFSQNILLSETERLTLGKIADPEKRNVNLNVLVIGGSGSGKTRYHIKPNLLQMNASYVCSDPKGTVIEEVGRALVRGGYKIKVLNTIDFSCSMHYNPFVYLHSETDILTLVTVIMTNTQGEAKGGDGFWEKAEALLYQALIAYIYYEAPAEERNMNTLLDMLNACECREDDENFKSAVDLLFEQLEQRNPDHFAARQYKKFKMAAGLTIPDFDLEIIGSHLYTVDEMKIINQIAGVYSDMGQNKKAADIYYQLLKYVQKHQQEAVISSGMLPMVLGNYARALDLCGYYKDAVDYAQRGIEACVRYGHYQMLYACLAIQAESYHFMKQDEKSAEAYHEAYYLCKVIGRKESMLAIQEEAKNYIGLEFRFK